MHFSHLKDSDCRQFIFVPNGILIAWSATAVYANFLWINMTTISWHSNLGFSLWIVVLDLSLCFFVSSSRHDKFWVVHVDKIGLVNFVSFLSQTYCMLVPCDVLSGFLDAEDELRVWGDNKNVAQLILFISLWEYFHFDFSRREML